MLPSRSHSPSRRKGEPRRGRLARCTLVGLAIFNVLLCIIKIDSATASNYKPMHYKQYAFMQLNYSFTEFYCLDDLYTAESRWNPKARNGSHYGIPQGKSNYLATATWQQQIEWGIKYNLTRYGSMCKALDHYKIKGWH